MIGRFSNTSAYRELFDAGEIRLCLVGGALALGSFLWQWLGVPGAWVATLLALASVACNGAPIILEAARGLWERRVNVDELVSLAILASLAQGEFLTAAVVSFIMTLGSQVEEAISERARRSIEALARMTPENVTLLDGQDERAVPLSSVRVGDRLLVKPGERVPVDGVIVRGASAVDESSVTGESIPVTRQEGDTVLAGTLSYNGVVEITASHVGEDTALGRVVKLVVEAEAHKPQAARLVDAYAAWFTPLVLACAVLVWWFTGESSRAVAVLVAGCPCALLMAAPTATVAAVARAAKFGVLVKGGRHLEEVARADAVLFDKTGTLTLGEPRVEDIITIDGVSREELLALAAGAEQDCNHPLARAVLRAAREANVPVVKADCVLNEIGTGVRAVLDGRTIEVGTADLGGGDSALPPALRAQFIHVRDAGATPLLVYRDGIALGLLSVSDTVRPAAHATLERLQKLGFSERGILSGDHAKAVERVGASVGITRCWSGLKPQDKLQVIDELQRRGRRVLFVGDGVNDAPALARANVGVAMGGAGTDVALETAGIALTHDDISRLPFLVRLARRMLALIKVNIGLGLLFNVVAIYGSSWGLLSPIAASLFHNVGSIIVVLSSSSLLAFGDATTTRSAAGAYTDGLRFDTKAPR